jgi:hypothetical protein
MNGGSGSTMNGSNTTSGSMASDSGSGTGTTRRHRSMRKD